MNELNKNSIYLVFFSSKHLVSKCINCYERIFLRNVYFSHVGLLFHSSLLKSNLKKICYPINEYLVLESTLGGPLNDNIYNTCDKIEFGVQLRYFRNLLERYKEIKGKIAISEIKNIDLNIFCDIIFKYINKSYDFIPTNLLTIHLPFPTFNIGGVFCSELVFRILKDMKMDIQTYKKSKKVSPNNLISSLEDICFLSELKFLTY